MSHILVRTIQPGKHLLAVNSRSLCREPVEIPLHIVNAIVCVLGDICCRKGFKWWCLVTAEQSHLYERRERNDLTYCRPL